ncbi:sugar phosphate isomerase/epimerase family protein [Thermodesulfobacteriota bacterium]
MLYGAMNSPVRPVLEELESIAELGFDYLELTMDAPEAHHKIIRQERDTLMRALERLRMGIVCHLPTFVSTADLTPVLREASLNEVLESMEVAAGFEPLKVVLHPSHISGLGILVRDKVHRYAMKSLEAIVAKADRLGIYICIENMFPHSGLLADPQDFVEIFQRFPALGLTLDTGHAHLTGKGVTKSLEFINKFDDRIGHIHVSDNFGTNDNHLPIGTGTIDFPTIIKALKKIEYDGTITLEVFSLDRDYLRISREKLAAMVASC